MSRSRKKPFVNISKPWYKNNEKSLRHKVKKACQEASFDPDQDWEDLYLTNKFGSEYGTKWGFNIPPDEDDEDEQNEYNRLKRK